MSLSSFIASRYLRSQNGTNAVNIINWLSLFITIIGTASLFVVLSGFAGLREFSLEFSNYFDPDLKVQPAQGKTLQASDAMREKLLAIDGVADYAAVLEERAYLEYDGRNTLAVIKGVDSNYERIIQPDSILLSGNWITPGLGQVVAGAGINQKLSMGLFSYTHSLKAMVPKPGTGQVTDLTKAFETNSFNAVGIYSINDVLDDKYIFVDLEEVQALLGHSSQTISALELKLEPNADEDAIRAALTTVLDQPLMIKNKLQLNDALYKMLNAENLAIYLIFTLVLIIALFNVVGGIIMTLLDKKENMQTLLALGATIQQIRMIFFKQGLFMTILGGVIGITLGALIIWIQMQFAPLMITYSIPYPVSFTLGNLLLSFATIAILGTGATWLASSRVRKGILT